MQHFKGNDENLRLAYKTQTIKNQSLGMLKSTFGPSFSTLSVEAAGCTADANLCGLGGMGGRARPLYWAREVWLKCTLSAASQILLGRRGGSKLCFSVRAAFRTET